MYPQVLQALLNRVPPSSKAVIHGFRRYNIRGQVFPGTIEAGPDAAVRGLLLRDLTPDDLVVLDEFEGDEYYKLPVRPEVLEGAGAGGAEDAVVYLWQQPLRHLLYGDDWDPEAFADTHLTGYVEMCRQFAEELRTQLGKPSARPLGFASSE